MDESQFNILNEEEKRVILDKGTEYPSQENTIITMIMALISVKDVIRHFIYLKINSNPIAVGQVLMMKFRGQ